MILLDSLETQVNCHLTTHLTTIPANVKLHIQFKLIFYWGLTKDKVKFWSVHKERSVTVILINVSERQQDAWWRKWNKYKITSMWTDGEVGKSTIHHLGHPSDLLHRQNCRIQARDPDAIRSNIWILYYRNQRDWINFKM